ALMDFDDAIRLNSKYPEAYFNRSILNLKMKQFDSAIGDLKTAIALRPNNKNYHGALAAAYAEQDDIDRFYEQLETALKKGFDVEKVPAAFASYRQESRFKALLAKYQ
ncbi:MAG: tetratricopeptide repeat protein, partial [Bacteroidota bacterium]